MVFWFLVTEINVCSKSHSTIGQIYQNMIKLITFFTILEGFETDSAKSSLGFLDDLSEGHLLFFIFWKNFAESKKNPKKGLIWPQRRCRESKKGVWNSLDRKNLVSFSWKFDDFCIIPQNCEIPKVNCNIFWSREDAST